MKENNELNLVFSDLNELIDSIPIHDIKNNSETINEISELLTSIAEELDELITELRNSDQSLMKDINEDESDDETLDTYELEKELNSLNLANSQSNDETMKDINKDESDDKTLDTYELEKELNSLNLANSQSNDETMKDINKDESDDRTLDTYELEKELNSLNLANSQPNDETLDTSEINSLTIHDWLKKTFKNTNSSGIQQMINTQTNDLPSLMKTIAEQKTQPDFYRFWSIMPKAGCGSGRRKETRALYEAIKILPTPFSSEQLKTAYEQELNKEQPSLFKQWFGF
jgi:hypothetical protein